MDTCNCCGGKVDYYMGPWCPKCDKPDDEVVSRVLNYFKVSTYITAQEGYDDEWTNEVLNTIGFPGNDCYIRWWVTIEKLDPDPEIDPDGIYDDTVALTNQFNAGLMKYFNLQDGDEILLHITW